MPSAARPAILISGYYGFGNVGDEAVLAGMVQSLRARLGPVPIIVLSADPPATVAAHGVEAVPRNDPSAIFKAMRRSRLFLSGGGSLLQDVTSGRSALYYLGVLRLAQRLLPRTMVFAAGLGPLNRPYVRILTRRVLRRTDVVSVRDGDSAALLRTLGIEKEPVLTADPAVLLIPPNPAGPPAAGAGSDTPLIGAVVRPWGHNAFVEPLAAALTDVARRRGARVVVVPFHPALDLAVSRRLAALCAGTVIETPLQPVDALALIARLRVLIGLRLHALLFSAASGVPPVGLAYDPKVAALFHDLEIEGLLPLDTDRDAVAGALDRAWERREVLRPALLAAAARLRDRAEIAAEAAVRLYAAV